jgi:hypothetical protein
MDSDSMKPVVQNQPISILVEVILGLFLPIQLQIIRIQQQKMYIIIILKKRHRIRLVVLVPLYPTANARIYILPVTMDLLHLVLNWVVRKGMIPIVLVLVPETKPITNQFRSNAKKSMVNNILFLLFFIML